MGIARNLWPTRKIIPKHLEEAVTPNQSETRLFASFNLQQNQLKASLQKGAKLPFSGQAQGTITVDVIEEPEGREVVNDRVFRFTGTTDKGMHVKAHIWYCPEDSKNEAQRTVIFVDLNQTKQSQPVKPQPTPENIQPKFEAKIRFADGFEDVRDTYTTGNILYLRVKTSTGWTEKTVEILTRTVTDKTIRFKVMGDHKLATVILDKENPMESKIIVDA